MQGEAVGRPVHDDAVGGHRPVPWQRFSHAVPFLGRRIHSILGGWGHYVSPHPSPLETSRNPTPLSGDASVCFTKTPLSGDAQPSLAHEVDQVSYISKALWTITSLRQ